MVIGEADIQVKKCSQSDKIVGLYVARELGQAIGIGNTTVSGAIMHATTSASSKFTDDDKNAVCGAYPASGGKCQSNSECEGGLACVGGKCGLCSSNADCGGNSACEDGTCVKSCKSHSECEGGLVCRGDRCTSCENDSECGSDRYCDQDVCAAKCKNAEQDCNTDQLCMPDGRCIDPNTCATHDHCKQGEFCRIGTCASTKDLGKTCQGQKDCGSGLECLTDEGKSFCTSWCLKQGSACPGGFVCKPFDEERSFCALAPPEKKPDNKGGDNKGGAGCSISSNDTGMGGAEFMFALALMLLLVGRIRRR